MRWLPLLLMCACAALAPARALLTQNVLLVIVDDLGADSLALLNDHPGARFAPTPTLDALAARGVVFRNAFAHPTCTPTRASILTGRHPFRTGMGTAISNAQSGPPLRAEELTLPEILTANPALGVTHASVGKWHLAYDFDSPNTVGGWSHYAGNILGAIPNYSNWGRTENGVTALTTDYATTRQINDGIAWLSGLPPGQRWFLWVACNAPHSPFHKPPNALHDYDDLPASPATPARPYYEAMLQSLDTELGRLLAGVDTATTTVVVTGDNGTPGSVIQPPFDSTRAKGTPYQGGCRVPLLVAGPDVEVPGRSVTNLVHAVDLWATLLELLGADLAAVTPRDRAIDSRSLLPLLQNQPLVTAVPEILVEQFGDNLSATQAARSAQDAQYKLIRFDAGPEELYHLALDPLENTNLLSRALTVDEQRAHDRLAARLEDWTEPARPRLDQAATSGARFTLGLTPFFDHTYALERAPDPDGPWTEPAGVLRQLSQDRLQFVDLRPPSTGAVYRVRAEKP